MVLAGPVQFSPADIALILRFSTASLTRSCSRSARSRRGPAASAWPAPCADPTASRLWQESVDVTRLARRLQAPLLLAAGATYEKRVRDLRRVGDRVARLS